MRYYKGGVDPWNLTLIQWKVLIEAVVDISEIENGETNIRANTDRLFKNRKRLQKFEEVLEESQKDGYV